MKSTPLNKTLIRLGLCALLLLVLSTPLLYYLTTEFYAEDMMDLIEEYQSHGTIKSDIDLKEDVAIGMLFQCLMTAIAIVIAMVVTSRAVSRNFRIQKEFTENASHELQTPIAILRSQLDLLLQENLDERAMRMVQEMYDTITRMNHLNRSLLLLAKIDNRQYAEKETLDVGVLIEKLAEQYATIYPGRIRLSLPETTVKLTTNPTLLEVLVNNLAVNAIRHSKSGLPVCISLEADRLVVSNVADSESLSPENLFVCFGNRTQNPKGNGLGLAIVKQICNFNHWDVSYHYNEAHPAHVFTVCFR